VRIRTFNDPVLRRAAAPVRRVTGSVKRLARSMVETMREYAGVGLAAPQVGVSKRLIVIDAGEEVHILINPRITASSGSEVDWEGCLSFPGLLAEVERARTVSVEATGLDGKSVWLDAEDFFARALQHEIDHLDGVVILDRARDIRRIEPEETAQADGKVSGPDTDSHSGPGPGPGPDADPGAGGGPRPRTTRPLKVAFMGTPEFALPTLETLAAAGHEVVGVVTQPDRPAGRGKSRRPPPVKRAAEALGVPVWQGTAAEVSRSLAGVLAGWGAEIGVVVAFGVILPADVLRTPALGCVNLHASLLPDYRGAAPIQRAIMDGRKVTGVTVIQMDEGMDTGDIIVRREVPVAHDETAGTLHDRLAAVGADLVVEALELLGAGRARPVPQPDREAPSAPRIGPEDEEIDWNRPAEVLERQVRALSPVPGAHTFLRGRRVKLWRVAVAGTARGVSDPAGTGNPADDGPAVPGGYSNSAQPGEVVGLDEGYPVVATGRGRLVLRTVQPAGGSRMEGNDFANGYRVRTGDGFGPE